MQLHHSNHNIDIESQQKITSKAVIFHQTNGKAAEKNILLKKDICRR